MYIVCKLSISLVHTQTVHKTHTHIVVFKMYTREQATNWFVYYSFSACSFKLLNHEKQYIMQYCDIVTIKFCNIQGCLYILYSQINNHDNQLVYQSLSLIHTHAHAYIHVHTYNMHKYIHTHILVSTVITFASVSNPYPVISASLLDIRTCTQLLNMLNIAHIHYTTYPLHMSTLTIQQQYNELLYFTCRSVVH